MYTLSVLYDEYLHIKSYDIECPTASAMASRQGTLGGNITSWQPRPWMGPMRAQGAGRTLINATHRLSFLPSGAVLRHI